MQRLQEVFVVLLGEPIKSSGPSRDNFRELSAWKVRSTLQQHSLPEFRFVVAGRGKAYSILEAPILHKPT